MKRKHPATKLRCAILRGASNVFAAIQSIAGLTTFLSVLDAERNVQQAELSLADSTATVSTDLVAVYKALGGGWDAVPAVG